MQQYDKGKAQPPYTLATMLNAYYKADTRLKSIHAIWGVTVIFLTGFRNRRSKATDNKPHSQTKQFHHLLDKTIT